MRWERGYRSADVVDRRGMAPAMGGGGGLVGILFLLFRWLGLPGLVIGLVVFAAISFCNVGGDRPLSREETAVAQAGDEELASFVSFVLDDVQRTWTEKFTEQGRQYERAKLVLFNGRVDSACGLASSAVGPFYCPRDHRAYIDLSFYRQLRQRLGAPGDFAQAYVIAHEIGHHVQNQLGTLGGDKQSAGAGRGSVRTELQADCYAGVWAHSTAQRDLLESGDLEEAMRAAEAIGDDALQRAGRGSVQPESWTHGSSEQRMRWFRRGYETGRVDACDTFNASSL